MKNLRLSDLNSSLGCKLFQYPTKPLISIVEKKTRRDAKKTGELDVPVKPSRDHTTENKVRTHSSTISFLHIYLLNISQLLGETRNSRDSVGLFLDSLIQFESLNKDMKTLNKTIVLVYVFFSSHKLFKNASFPFCLRYHGTVCTRLWEKNPRQAHNRKHKLSKKVRDFDKYHVLVNNVGCLDDKAVSDIIFIMKTYYWPPWPWLRKTSDKHCVKLSSTTSTDAPILYRWLKHYVRKKNRWKTVCPKSCDRWHSASRETGYIRMDSLSPHTKHRIYSSEEC